MEGGPVSAFSCTACSMLDHVFDAGLHRIAVGGSDKHHDLT
jgi:hypothetical protein